MRLNKYLSAAGVCSRRKADEAILAGEVTIDGIPAKVGQQVEEGQRVLYKGREVNPSAGEILLVVNKPKGIVCTAEKREKNNIVDFVGYPERVYPIGRLDKDSRGLILMTNQGALADEIMRAGKGHEKEYIVKTDRPINGVFLQKMSSGVYLDELGITTRKCSVKYISERSFSIVLNEGKNRQIRRMCEHFDYRVRDLKRIRVVNITLKGLPEGKYRKASREEINELWKQISNSR